MSAFFRFIAMLLSLLNALSVSLRLKKIEVKQNETEISDVKLVNSTESPMCKTAEYACNVGNSVQAVFTTTARKAYRMSNGQMILTHKLTGAEKTAGITDKNGNIYVENTFRTFYTDKCGIEHYFENTLTKGRINTIRLGEYYYDCHVRDFDDGNFNVDKNFHVYPDKVYAQYSLLAKEPTTELYDFGSEITVPYLSVNKLEIKDKNGTHGTLDGIDAESVEYAAFDIKDTGVISFIVPSDGSAKKLTVTKGILGYEVRQYAAFDASLGLNDYAENGGLGMNKITFGFRIYTDGTHTFDGAEKAAFEERNPLADVTVEKGTANSVYLGYDALRGAYTVQMNGTDFQTAYDNPQMQFTAPISIKSDDDRTLYFRSYGLSGCLEAAAILDENDNLVPMEVEVCKNFCGDGGEGFTA